MRGHRWLRILGAFFYLIDVAQICSSRETPDLSDSAAPPTFEGLVEREGYKVERHVCRTEDGYLLTLFRIPFGKEAPSIQRSSPRPAVLLQHGLLDSSAAWVLNGAQRSLGFILADAGFDVWMSNSRGNTYSRRHVNFDAASAEFWDFTYDDMARYDMPAFVDYILKISQVSQIGYVGHSQGTTIALAALSSIPALANKVGFAALLAPVTFTGHVTSRPLVALAQMRTDELIAWAGAREFLPNQQFLSDLFGPLCSVTPVVCTSLIAAFCGYSTLNVNNSQLPLYLAFTPAGTSVKNMEHWAQGVRRESVGPQFAMFDYGDKCTTPFGLPQRCNKYVYGQPDPPVYNLGGITTPLAILSGGLDQLSDADDLGSLISALQPNVSVYTHVEPTYQHLDFTWGWEACTRIYPAIVDLLRVYSRAWSAE